MRFQSLQAYCFLGLTVAWTGNALPSQSFDERNFQPGDVISKDVLIVGGGSTGTYAAVRLLDSNKTVVVVEREAILGGHTNTYHDPTTGVAIDYGVVIFHNNDFVKNYFSRFNIPLTVASFGGPTNTKHIDFRTGQEITSFIQQDPSAALQGYYAQISQYPYVEAGFDLPSPVPEDLLLPFGSFLKKYSLQNMSQFAFLFTQGLGNVFDQPTLYVFKNFGLEIIQDLQIGFLTTARHDNSELYRKAATELLAKGSLLLSSNVLDVCRTAGGVKAIVSTPTGKKLIRAKRILITTPPKVNLLNFMDLSDKERGLFSQFNNSAYYTGILRNTGIPDNTTLINARPDTEYFVPRLPGIYSLNPTGLPGLLNVKYGGPAVLSLDSVKASIVSAIRRLGTAGTVPGAGAGTIDFVAFQGHNPFELTVCVDAIRKGFYKQLYSLQGERATWYTGAAFHTHDSSMLWVFTEKIVQRLLATL